MTSRGQRFDPGTWRRFSRETLEIQKTAQQLQQLVSRLGLGEEFTNGQILLLSCIAVQVEHLTERVAELEEEIETLRALAPEKVVVLRNITGEQAKQEIQELFRSGETLFYSDIAQRLAIDLPLVVEICQELEKEEEIEIEANPV